MPEIQEGVDCNKKKLLRSVLERSWMTPDEGDVNTFQEGEPASIELLQRQQKELSIWRNASPKHMTHSCLLDAHSAVVDSTADGMMNYPAVRELDGSWQNRSEAKRARL